MIAGRTCLGNFCLHFIALSFVLRGGNAADTTCNNGKFLCKPFGNCDLYKNRARLPNDLIWCDVNNFIVCCPQPLSLDAGPKYYKGIEKPYVEDCKKWHDEFYPVCRPEKLIVGGKNATLMEFPHMALLGTKSGNFYKWSCGGSLINPRYVLTAAHCMEQEITPTHVRLGELDYNRTDDGSLVQDFAIRRSIPHPQYDAEDENSYDIAIVELDGIARLSLYVLPICLPASNGNENERLVTAGWGSIGNAQDAASHLQKVVLERFDDSACRIVIGKSFADDGGVQPDYQLCAGSFNDNRDTCQGDSGGPLFVQNPDFPCMFLIHGITSYGKVCGMKNIPGVYTRVYPYVDWIEGIVWRT